MKGENDKIGAEERLMAQLALLTQEDEPGPCPEPGQLALLVDQRLAGDEEEQLWQHLGQCQKCYDQWHIVAAELATAKQQRSKAPIIAVSGSLLAIAASLLLYLNIQPTPMDLMPPPDALEMAESASEPDQPRPAKAKKELASRLAAQQAMTSEPALTARRSKSAPPRQAPAPARSGPETQKLSVGQEVFSDQALQPKAEEMTSSAGLALEEDHYGEEMVDMKQVLPTLLRKVKSMEIDGRITVKTYKRDRGLTIRRLADDQLEIEEFGYENKLLVVPVEQTKKNIKAILKREFPRSNKVWLHQSQP